MPHIKKKKKAIGAVDIKAHTHNLGLATEKSSWIKKKKKKVSEKSPFFSVELSKTDMIKANM